MPSISGKSKHSDRKKAVWLEVTGDLISHIALPSIEDYDHNRAYELLKTMRGNKHLAKCKLQCLFDAIKVKRSSAFGSHPPRKSYLYRDIERFYSFADHPTMLILGCMSSDKRKRYYDVFKFVERHVQEVCDLISQAHNHPMFILSEQPDTLIRYQSSQSSLAGEVESNVDRTEDTHDEYQVDLQLDKTESPSPSLSRPAEEPAVHWPSPSIGPDDELINTDRTNVDSIEKEEIVGEFCEPVSSAPVTDRSEEAKNSIPNRMRDDPLFSSLCEHVNLEDVWAVDMTYVDVHPKYGSQIASSGPTYLFVAHHKRQEVKNRNARRESLDSYSLDYDKEAEELREQEEADRLVSQAGVGFTTTYVQG